MFKVSIQYFPLKYLHIYLPVFIFLWIALYLDSLAVSETYSNSQLLTNILVVTLFIFIYFNTSKQIKRLMLFGLLVATIGEIFFSLILGMYTYRLENLPLYIPFGHSIIYAGVYYIVKEPLIRKYQKVIIKILYAGMILYSTIWLVFASDIFGFICMLVIVLIFKYKPHTKLFFLLMYFMVVYLELIGTYYGCWYWPGIWFGLIDIIPSANPPSGISVFYFAFDAGCLLLYMNFFPHKWSRRRSILRYKPQITK